MRKIFHRRILVGFLLVGVAALFGFVALVPPEGQFYWPRCWFNYFTGFHCPGCGGTRSLHLMAHGDIVGALHQNALFVLIVLPLGLWFYLRAMRYVIRGEYRSPKLTSRAVNIALLVIVLFFFVVRNIPFEPFSHLAPQPLHADAHR